MFGNLKKKVRPKRSKSEGAEEDIEIEPWIRTLSREGRSRPGSDGRNRTIDRIAVEAEIHITITHF